MVYKKVYIKGAGWLSNEDISATAAIAESKLNLNDPTHPENHATRHVDGGADEITSPLDLLAIPDLPASKITSGILAAARGGLGKALSPNWTNDYILVYKTATDNFVMEPKTAPQAHAATHEPGGTDEVNDIDILNSGVLLSAHSARHQPGGADALPTGIPSSIGTTNSEGTSTSFPRLDHVHAHPSGLGTDLHHAKLHSTDHNVGGADALSVGVPTNIGISNSEGYASNFVRCDHVHRHPDLPFDLHSVYLLADGSRAMTGPLDLEVRTSDPTLTEGRLWYRGDIDELRIAKSATEFEKIAFKGYGFAEATLFENGFMDTISPAEMANTGTGSYAGTPAFGDIQSGAVANDQHSAYVQWTPAIDLAFGIFDKLPQFEAYLYFPSVAAMNFWMILGGGANVPEDVTQKKVGIKIINGALYAFSGDGTAQSTLDLTTSLAAGSWYRIRVKHTGTGIMVYVDGNPTTEKTTNIPAGSLGTDKCFQLILQTTEAVNKRVFFKPVKFLHAI